MDAKYNDHLGILEQHEWQEFYPWAKDEIPPDAPEPLGNTVDTIKLSSMDLIAIIIRAFV